MKKTAALLLAAIFALAFFTCASAAAAADVLVDGVKVSFADAEPELRGDTLMIPVRFVTEAMGMSFKWYTDENRAEISAEGFEAELRPGSDSMTYTRGGVTKSVPLKAASVLVNKRLLASADAVRFIAAMGGYNSPPDEIDGKAAFTSPKAAKAVVNGAEVLYQDCGPVMLGDAVMYPVRFVTEAMGLSFIWNSTERIGVVSGGGSTAVFSVGSNRVELGGAVYEADKKVVLSGLRMYASADALVKLAEYFGAEASSNGSELLINTADRFTVTVDGREPAFSGAAPMRVNGVPMLPLGPICDAAGLGFEWSEAGGFAKITNSDESKYVIFRSESAELVKYETNTETGRVPLEAPAAVVKGGLTAPAGAVAEAVSFLGLEAEEGENSLAVSSAVKPSSESDKGEITVTYNGKKVDFPDAECLVSDGRTLVPVRAVTESMGMNVIWNGETKTAVITRGGDSLAITVGSAAMVGVRADGAEETAKLDAPAVIADERIYVPIRAVMEYFGAEVGWNAETRTVIITEAEPKPAEADVALLGFTISAPEGAETVSVKVTDGSEARIDYTANSTAYVFIAGEGDVASRYGEVTGRGFSFDETVNGVATVIRGGVTDSGLMVAKWSVGGFNFSLAVNGDGSLTDLIANSSAAAKTFRLTREVGEAAPEGAEVGEQ